MTTARRRYVSVSPTVVARWLGVHDETVKRWIRSKQLTALNIGTSNGAPRYRIFRKDLVVFLQARGLAAPEHVSDLFG